MHLTGLDFVVVGAYGAVLLLLAQWVSREKDRRRKNAQDYFLAGRTLPWWAIGASLIAANISAEQIIGMSGSAYVMGIAIASYEWMAALTLLLVAKYLLPVFLKLNIYTMPQFLEVRFDARVRTLMASFWLAVYVFVNLTSILWLGALAINTITGLDSVYGLTALGLFAAAYSLYGGLKAVALTDIIQVVLLIFGGLLIAYTALDSISDGAGVIAGFQIMLDEVPEKFDMILSSDNPHYASLPGISVLVGGLWIMNLSYWGLNQYIIQRALAARSAREGQKGILFAAFLKLLMPVLVVLPGIAATMLSPDLVMPDSAYPEIMKLLPAGVTGLVFAALIAAIVSSLASMMNSVSTIFTMDVYRHAAGDRQEAKGDHHLVRVGRIVGFTAICIAMLVAKPLLGNFDQAFQYIQEFTGFFTPGVTAIFLLGIFWKHTTAEGAIGAALGSALLSIALKITWPALPFIDRVGLVFLMCVCIGMAVSYWRPCKQRTIAYGDIDTSTSSGFNLGTTLVVLVLAAFYITWW